jgi:hypothetical protein
VPADRCAPFDRRDDDRLPKEPAIEALTAVMIDMLDLVSARGAVRSLTAEARRCSGRGEDP